MITHVRSKVGQNIYKNQLLTSFVFDQPDTPPKKDNLLLFGNKVSSIPLLTLRR